VKPKYKVSVKKKKIRKSNNDQKLVFIAQKEIDPFASPEDPSYEPTNFEKTVDLDKVGASIIDLFGDAFIKASAGTIFPNTDDFISVQKTVYQQLLNVVSGVNYDYQEESDIIRSECINLLVILYKMSINSNFDLLTINYNHISIFTTLIGDPKQIGENPANIIPLLLFSLSFNIETYKKKFILFGFEEDPKTKKWKPVEDNDAIKMKDHPVGEPLVCPKCKREYHSACELLFGQIVTPVPLRLDGNLADAKPGDKESATIKMMTPAIVMTPICVDCYNGFVNKNLQTMQLINVSPVFVYPLDKRNIVPLLPKCYIDNINNPKENMYCSLSNMNTYWPATQTASVCKIIRDEVDNELVKNNDKSIFSKKDKK
jgi:hypothetical protein